MSLVRSLLFLALACAVFSQTPATVRVSLNDVTGKLEAGKMSLGQGGLSEEPMWEERAAEIRALHPRLVRLFIQEYFNLMPAVGQYDFSTLDRSVDLILKAGAKPLMAIAFKPTVLYPQVDQDIVFPNDWKAWEGLIEAMVRHYKERGAGIRYWEIGNEPDIGESGGCPYRFTPQDYTLYYRRTAAAILRADPEARVGGPALANYKSPILPALLDFCEKENVPLHFVSWHGYTSNPQWFGDSTREVKRLIAQRPSLQPELFLDEWNIALMKPQDSNLSFQPAFVLEAVRNMIDAGLDYSCYYHIRDYHVEPETFSRFMSPHGVAFMASWWNRWPQYHGLFDFENHVRPAYYAFSLLSRVDGDRLRVDDTTSASVKALAAYDPVYRQYSVLVWNYSNEATQVKLDLQGLEKKATVNRIRLDADTPRVDSSARLNFLEKVEISPENSAHDLELEPYGVQLWFFSKDVQD